MEIWRPEKEHLSESNIARYISDRGLGTLDAFISFTYERPEAFWSSFVDEVLRVKWYEKYTKVLDLSSGVQWPRWFIGGKINIADQLEDSARPLVKWEGEDGSKAVWSYSEVLYKARAVASWLKRNGLNKGDRVGIFMPMVPEIVPVMLGAIRAGGIIVPLFSGFGKEAIRVRLEDSEAKFVFASDISYRRGRPIDMLSELRAGLAPSVRNVVVHERGGLRGDYVSLAEVFKTGGDYVEAASSEDPIMIIYTSGTTGKPKGTVHTHDGFPIKAAADVYFHFDLREGETLSWITDMGWMMGPWMVFAAYLLRGSMAFFEGAPDYPKDRVWRFVEEHRVSALGLAATLTRYLRSIEAAAAPGQLDSLKAFGNTGEPIDVESWLWLYRMGRGRIPIINYSGGTEISGGILGCYVVREMKPSSFNGMSPGIKAAVFTEDGKPAPPGTEGELVVLSVWPGMTRGFWRDPQRYLETYWSKWPGVWAHGDAAMVDQEGFYYILGRADDTIKVAGKRLGPAEIETVLNAHPAVAESACIGVPHDIKGEVPICFVVLKPGYEPSEELKRELIKRTEEALGKAFGAVEDIKFVKLLPKTRNAKIMRRVIRAVYLGRNPGDLSALESPEAIEEIKRVAIKS
ncbi:AMP-binding protein [Thermoproteus tenax]|uniref:acetate--CoA ligase n=1 Tax=Thermoproteus tenax (strain ATCC 35583 / DSM 2078 / JCM 9277 / NBRC 100435 / Kra 1) TaxID=768679 RepID=G4RNT6_THETK|nr:AMP-binding protein [Thermoproteus tenax]CCC81230.1 acetyl-CoA synthetase [Thermoproteus tenax Kra 1]